MKSLSRSTALKIAATLSFLNGAYGFIFSLPLLARGMDDLNQANDAPPYFVMIGSFVLSVIQIIAASGTWRNQRWGIIATLLTNTFGALLAAPGLLFAPTQELWLSATISLLVSVACIVLCLWRDAKATLA